MDAGLRQPRTPKTHTAPDGSSAVRIPRRRVTGQNERASSLPPVRPKNRRKVTPLWRPLLGNAAVGLSPSRGDRHGGLRSDPYGSQDSGGRLANTSCRSFTAWVSTTCHDSFSPPGLHGSILPTTKGLRPQGQAWVSVFESTFAAGAHPRSRGYTSAQQMEIGTSAATDKLVTCTALVPTPTKNNLSKCSTGEQAVYWRSARTKQNYTRNY